MFARVAAGLGVALALVAGPAPAKELKFRAALSGEQEPTRTGSKATAQAVILVDTDRRTVDVRLYVNGLTVDQLSNGLRGTPMGPIHLHIYGGHDHGHSADAALVFPLPYGPSYAPGQDSFQVETGAVDYAKGAALVNTQASFEDFVGSLESGRIVLNVHTNRFADGEISGDVVPGGA
jgi:hypothetical protein